MTEVGTAGAAAGAGEFSARAEALFRRGEGGAEWYAFRTRPRREKKASGVLLELAAPHYLPLRKNVTPRGRGRYSFMVPLFPGYLFGCCTAGQRLQVMRSGHLLKWLEVVDQEQLLRELREIYLACEQGAGLRLYPQLTRGRRVRVVRGPLTGVEGRISRRGQRYRLVLNVSALGTAVATEVDMDDVVLAGEAEVEADDRSAEGGTRLAARVTGRLSGPQRA